MFIIAAVCESFLVKQQLTVIMAHARKSRPNSKVLFSSTKILKYLTASSNFENVIDISQGGLSQDQSCIQALSFNRAKSHMLAPPAFQKSCMYFAFT